MNADADVITVPVAINVTDVQRFQGCGSLTAMAVVTVDIYEVPLTWVGVQVRRTTDGRLKVQSPQFRHPKSGLWMPCILAPATLTDAIGVSVLEALEVAP